jgi:hypothetical protein
MVTDGCTIATRHKIGDEKTKGEVTRGAERFGGNF